MQPNSNRLNKCVRNHPGILSVRFRQNPISGLIGAVYANILTTDGVRMIILSTLYSSELKKKQQNKNGKYTKNNQNLLATSRTERTNCYLAIYIKT